MITINLPSEIITQEGSLIDIKVCQQELECILWLGNTLKYDSVLIINSLGYKFTILVSGENSFNEHFCSIGFTCLF